MKSKNSLFNEKIKELTEIEVELERNIETTLWISDLHGAGKKFEAILKGRFGLVWRSAYEALPKTFSQEKLEYLDHLIREEKYLITKEYTMERQDVISSLVKIIQYKIQSIKDFDKIRHEIKESMVVILENLILNFTVPNIIYENNRIADQIISSLSRIAKKVILGHLIILGDVFDRGDEPDKILEILSSSEMKSMVKFVWGNHDILWMGAAAGNKSLIAEALRISTRYDNLEFLKRLKIDLSKLKKFALKLYPGKITGNFKAKLEISKKMEKTLALIQFKLEEQAILEYPQLEMESRLNLKKLAKLLKEKKTSGLTDTHFPTLDLKNPLQLTAEEQEIIDDLTKQFTTSSKIKELMRYLFKEGNMYYIYNYILNIHALVPSTEDGQLETFLGLKGKKLFDHIDKTVKEIGQCYLENKEQEYFQLALMFYLWCGPKSPFFGKHAMKTFERYFYKDKETHKEKLLFWGENVLKKNFMSLLLNEFKAERIVYGHTPINILKGQKIASPDGKAINIDGGFSDAYLARGHSLIHTPYSLYAIILPSQKEIIEAAEKKEPAKLMFEEISLFKNPKKIKDTFQGKKLLKRKNLLLKELNIKKD